jgi:hypothetical protein
MEARATKTEPTAEDAAERAAFVERFLNDRRFYAGIVRYLAAFRRLEAIEYFMISKGAALGREPPESDSPARRQVIEEIDRVYVALGYGRREAQVKEWIVTSIDLGSDALRWADEATAVRFAHDILLKVFPDEASLIPYETWRNGIVAWRRPRRGVSKWDALGAVFAAAGHKVADVKDYMRKRRTRKKGAARD